MSRASSQANEICLVHTQDTRENDIVVIQAYQTHSSPVAYNCRLEERQLAEVLVSLHCCSSLFGLFKRFLEPRVQKPMQRQSGKKDMFKLFS